MTTPLTLTREEAQQVLDVMASVEKHYTIKGWSEQAKATIKTLRARLAEKEQEPVAWCIVENGRTHGLVKSKPAVMNAEKWQPLYTAPPQREWVGLTDKERNRVLETTHPENRWTIAERIEAKLKEKNT